MAPRIKMPRPRTGQTLVGYDRNGNPIYQNGAQPVGALGTPQMSSSFVGPDGVTYYTDARGNRFCGSAPQTILKSHGSACPPGDCPPGQLAAALGRTFAGDRGCRELAYWVEIDTDATGEGGVDNQNSLVTMCPTRLIVVEETPLTGSRLTALNFVNVPQMIGDPIFLEAFAPDAVQAIPFVMNCLRAGLPFSLGISDAEPSSTIWVGFIGPMSG